MPVDYINPSTTKYLPGGHDPDNYLWIKLHAYEIKNMKSFSRSEGAIQKGETLSRFAFLAPDELTEELGHEWSDYESITSRTMDKYKSGKGAAKEVSTTVENFKESGNVPASDVHSYRVDTPLVYENSKRREYTFDLQLVTLGDDPFKEVLEPIRYLQKLSCPEMKGDTINLKMPALFRVDVNPVLYIRYAALTAIQVSYKPPYKGKIPMQAELTLNFSDVEPMYRRTFSQKYGYAHKVKVNGE